MTVSTIASVAAGLARAQSANVSKPNAVLSSLFAPSDSTTGQDIADLSSAASLQNKVAQFRIAAQNVAQAGSLLSAAQAGIGTISDTLTRMKTLASQAASATTRDDTRQALDSEFQALRSKIDTIARSTRFNNERLLDGSSAQLKLAQDTTATKDLSIGSLTDEALFGSSAPSLLSATSASNALSALDTASSYVATQQAHATSLEDGLGYAASTLESAIQNHEASRSNLSGTDLIQILLGGTSNTSTTDPSSLAAQVNRLPSNILQLLAE